MIIQNQASPSETKREAISYAQRWAIGLIDGNGHIGCEWSCKNKIKWSPNLKVSLHIYNAQAIYKLKTILKCGRITKHNNVITLRVRSRNHWYANLIPLFNAFPFRTNKHYDYQLVLKMLYLEKCSYLNDQFRCCNRNILIHDLRNLYHGYVTKGTNAVASPIIDQAYAHYKSGNLNLNPVGDGHKNTDLNKNQILTFLDCNWLAGFVEAEGNFYILACGRHGFALGQKLDFELIFLIHYALNIQSKLKIRPNYTMIDTKNRTTCIALGSVFTNRLLGMKGFEFSLWLRTCRKNQTCKSLKAKHIITTMKSKTAYEIDGIVQIEATPPYQV